VPRRPPWAIALRRAAAAKCGGFPLEAAPAAPGDKAPEGEEAAAAERLFDWIFDADPLLAC
jgi:hypothetical protein